MSREDAIMAFKKYRDQGQPQTPQQAVEPQPMPPVEQVQQAPLQTEPQPIPMMELMAPVEGESPLKSEIRNMLSPRARARRGAQRAISGEGGFLDRQMSRRGMMEDGDLILHDMKPEAMEYGAEMLPEMVSGSRRFEQEIEDMPSVFDSPAHNQMLYAGTATSSPEELAKAYAANMPEGAEVFVTDKGNYFIEDPQGNRFAVHAGFRTEDIGRLGYGIGREALITAATGGLGHLAKGARLVSKIPSLLKTGAREAALALGEQAGEAAVGGDFDLVDATTGAVTSTGMSKLTPSSQSKLSDDVIEDQIEDPLKRAAIKSAKGRKGAVEELAYEAGVSKEMFEAAERQGVTDYLQADHLSTSQEFKELQQLAKSQKGSPLNAQEIDGLKSLGDDAAQKITDIGATKNLGELSETIKYKMEKTVDSYLSKSNKIYSKIGDMVDPTQMGVAEKTISYLENRAREVGGLNNLKMRSPYEYNLLEQLQQEGGVTYGFIDDIRKEAGDKIKPSAVVDKDASKARNIYRLISEDQDDIIASIGGDEAKGLLSQGKSLVKARIKQEKRMQALFGKELDKALVGKVKQTKRLLKDTNYKEADALIKSVPKSMRKDFVASAVRDSFGDSTERGVLNFNSFNKFWKGVSESKQTKSLIFKNLPPEGRQMLEDFGSIVDGVDSALKTRARGGETLQDILRPAESFFKKSVSLMSQAAAAEGGGALLGLGGVGTGAVLMNAYKEGKRDVAAEFVKVVGSDDLKKSMIDLAKGKQGQEKAARRLSFSKPFREFARMANLDTAPKALERWILSSMRTTQNLTDTENVDENK